MTDTTEPYVKAMRLMNDGSAHVNFGQAQAFATLAQVDATDRQTAAIERQTAVFRELLAEDKAAADELRKHAPCGNPSWLHDSTDCPCKTPAATPRLVP